MGQRPSKDRRRVTGKSLAAALLLDGLRAMTVEERDEIRALLGLAWLAEPQGSPWMGASAAAVYLDCPLSRVRKLTMTGDLDCDHDGRRVLYHREKLDAFIRRGGAKSP